jgi:hypothetical protein
MGLWVVIGLYIYIYYLIEYCRAGGRVSTRPKFQKPLSKYLKYLYLYPSVYMLTGGQAGEWVDRIGRTGRVPQFFAHS